MLLSGKHSYFDLILLGTIVSTAEIESFEGESLTLFMNSVKIKPGSSNIPILGSLFDNFSGLDIRSLGRYLESTSIGYNNPKPKVHMKL